MKIALIDDNPVHLKHSRQLCEKAFESRQIICFIRAFSSVSDFLSQMKNFSPEIAVLDIEMPEKDGISLGKEINQYLPECRIIFLTSYIEYASDVYETDHIWFVVKNNAEKYFDSAIDKALKSIEEQNHSKDYLVIKTKGKSEVIPLRSVLYISKIDRKTQVVCDQGEYFDNRKPADLIPEKYLTRFVRCHQGYYVSLQRIKEIDHEDFVLDNGVRIPISRTFSKTARDAFFARYIL